MRDAASGQEWWKNTTEVRPLTREDLERAAQTMRDRPPHQHIVSPNAYRRYQQGETVVCVECGAAVKR